MNPRTPLPGFDGVAIEQLARGWRDGGLWADIDWLASRFWSAHGTARSVAWHHLVMSVGNFKRQPGRRLRPSLERPPTAATTERPQSFVPPGTDTRIAVDDPVTWRALCSALPGAAVATTTTLLAALWPDEHFVFDWRVHSAATALRVAAHLDAGGVDPASSSAKPLTFDDYERVRAWLVETASIEGLPLAALERALYLLSQKTPLSATARTWSEYADAVLGVLGRTR